MIHEAARRYAQAFFNLSLSAEKMEERERILEEIAQLAKKMPKFGQFLHNPQISQEQKKELLQKGVKDTQLIHFLLLLLDKGKFKYLPEIAAQFQQMSAEYRGVQEATLITAHPLDETLKQQLKTRLEKSASLKSVILNEKIEPTILGGGIVILGNQILDFSIQGRLERLKRALLWH